MTASPQTDELGKITGTFGVFRDVTDRKRAEEALRESETRMRSITDSAQDAILMMDPDGRVSYWNPAAERILGYTSAEALGRDLHSFIVPPRYHEAHLAAFPAFRNTGQGAVVGKTLDLEARRKDGQEISVQLSLSAIQLNGEWHAVGLLRDITDRKRAEEDKQKFVSLVEFSSDFISMATLDGRVLYLNQAGRDLVGIAKDTETPLKSILDYVPEEEKERFRGGIVDVALAQGHWEGEFSLRSFHSGVPIPVHFSLFVIKDRQTGEALALATVCRDMTERKMAEEALRESEKRFRMLFEQNLAGVYRSTLDGALLECNEAFARILGYESPEEILSPHLSGFASRDKVHAQRMTEFFHDSVDRAAYIERLYREKSLRNHENCLKRRDGSAVWVLENVSLIQGENEGPDILYGTVTDISERRRAEEALRSSEQRYRLLFERNLSGVFRTTLSGTMLDCNPAYARIFGFETPAELKDADVKQFYHHEADRQSLMALLTEVARALKHRPVLAQEGRKPGVGQGECHHDPGSRRRGGDRRHPHRHHRSQARRGGTPEGQGGGRIGQPVQERVSGQHEPRDPDAHERDHRHDRAGSGNASWTHSSASTSKWCESSAESLLTLINDILDFSKIEAGKLELESVDFDLAPAVQKTVELVSIRAREKGLETAWSIAPDVPAMVNGDPGAVQAGDHQPHGKRHQVHREGQRLGAHRENSAFLGTACSCDVPCRDTGIGIPKRQAGSALQELQPGGRFHDAEVRRHGAGPGHLEAAGAD